MRKMSYKFIKIIIISAILGIPAGLLVIFSAIAIDILKITTHPAISGLPILPLAQIISLSVIILIWYFISRKLYPGDNKILILGFLLLLIISFTSINYTLDLVKIGPKGEQIPMTALIFRGYELEGKKVIYAPWEKYELEVNETRKIAISYSFAFENSDFIYCELIGAKEGYPSYIIVIKSSIDEKQLVEAIVR